MLAEVRYFSPYCNVKEPTVTKFSIDFYLSYVKLGDFAKITIKAH